LAEAAAKKKKIKKEMEKQNSFMDVGQKLGKNVIPYWRWKAK